MRGKRVGTAWLIGLAALGSVVRPAGAQESKAAAHSAGNSSGHARTADEVARERRDLARRALGILDATIERGGSLAGLVEDYYYWSVRLVGCDIFLQTPADGPKTMQPEVYLASIKPVSGDEVLESFRAHHKRMQGLEERFHRLQQQGFLSPIAYQHILDHRVEAEIWLLREQARRESPAPSTPSP
jgi:hypothetical protein